MKKGIALLSAAVLIVLVVGFAGRNLFHHAARNVNASINMVDPVGAFRRAGRVRDEKRLYDLQTLRQALVLYHSAYGRYPVQLTELAGSFLPNIPVDPLTMQSYAYFATGKDGEGYSVIYALESGAQNIPPGRHIATPVNVAAQ